MKISVGQDLSIVDAALPLSPLSGGRIYRRIPALLASLQLQRLNVIFDLDGFAAAGAPSAKTVQRVLRSMQLRPPAAQVLHLHWGSATTEPLEVWRRRVIEMVIIATLRRDIARTLVPLGNVVESNPDRTVELQECWVASLDFHSPSCERWTHTRKHGQM
jgi:hypothetical protein